MNMDESVTRWIDGLRKGSPRSAQHLWERYFERLVQFAGRKLPASVKRDFDEEDVALSVFDSLCRGVEIGRFPRIDDRNNLWVLLVVITARKVMHHLRDATREKRGGGQVRGESAFGRDGQMGKGLDRPDYRTRTDGRFRATSAGTVAAASWSSS